MTKVNALKYPDIVAWLKVQDDKKDLRGVLRELHRLIKDKKEGETDLAWWHDVGTCVAQFVPKGNRRYGDNVIELLANDLRPDRDLNDWTLPNSLYRARDFVDKYKRRKDAESLGRRRNADDKPLTRLHVSVLLTVKDDAQRRKFLERCLKESWSAQELRRQIQNATGRKRGTGGRSPSPPKYSSAGVALRDIKVMADRWTAYHKAWYIGLRRLPVTDHNETMLQEIKDAKEGLMSVRNDVDKALKQVEMMEHRVKSKLFAGSTSRRAKTQR
jgi:hypothetical protein